MEFNKENFIKIVHEIATKYGCADDQKKEEKENELELDK